MKTVGKKISGETNANKFKQQIKYSFHNYFNLSNQQYLFHSLKLLGVTQQQYLKQTKLSFNGQFFSKNTNNSTTTKQFFYIVLKCMENLTTQQEFQSLKMWYMPRTTSQQVQFKKSFYNLLPKLQIRNKIPKNLILSKNILLGDTNNQASIQFLRILSQLSLRSLYMQKYSKNERLIQLQLGNCQSSDAHDINRFYFYPFVPMQQNQNLKLQLQQSEVKCLKNIYKAHIQCYRKKILLLAQKLNKQDHICNYQEIICNLLEQKQINQKLLKKIPKSIISQNRAFDRRRIIDKSNLIWEEISKIQCNYIQKQEFPLLKLDSQIDKTLKHWNPPSGISRVYDCNQQLKRIEKLKQECKKSINELKQFKQKMILIIKT